MKLLLQKLKRLFVVYSTRAIIGFKIVPKIYMNRFIAKCQKLALKPKGADNVQ